MKILISGSLIRNPQSDAAAHQVGRSVRKRLALCVTLSRHKPSSGEPGWNQIDGKTIEGPRTAP